MHKQEEQRQENKNNQNQSYIYLVEQLNNDFESIQDKLFAWLWWLLLFHPSQIKQQQQKIEFLFIKKKDPTVTPNG